MVLHLDEYKKENKVYGKALNHYDKLPKYLHEMTAEEIAEETKRHGTRSLRFQGLIMYDYFSWLNTNYDIDVVELNFALRNLIERSKNDYSDILSLKQLKRSIEENLIIAESETAKTLPDYCGLKAFYFLEWYGVLPKSAITIMLTDVSDDGKQVYIPAENRGILIDDDDVARFFSEYKQKTGFKRYRNSEKETPYPQKTFYRNTDLKDGEINNKTIYNIRQKFAQACGDERFTKKKVYYSGRYNQMLKEEYKFGDEFSASDKESCEIINRIFNKKLSFTKTSDIIRYYKTYKKTYLDIK